MTIVFRADASARIGAGHVMRCLTLSRELDARGVRRRFICREQRGDLIATLREQAVPVTVLPPPATPTTMADADYAGWLGVPADADAAQTVDALDGESPEWLVVDHYGLDARWERHVRQPGGRILAIDDLANRPHDCDVLLDQNYGSDRPGRYTGLVPASCRVLCGPRYALLAPEYASRRDAQRPRDGVVRRLLLYFGGADPANMTGEALTAVSAPEFRDVAVDVVIAANHPSRDALDAQAARRPGTIVHRPRPHLADLMTAADLAIGAGGGTTWERMCLGLPALVVSIADNQRSTCEALAAAGLIAFAGDAATVDAAVIRAALSALVADPVRRAALSIAGQQLVDGRGAARVADELLGLTQPSNT